MRYSISISVKDLKNPALSYFGDVFISEDSSLIIKPETIENALIITFTGENRKASNITELSDIMTVLNP